ncbi:MAG: EAL domain-containing protein [Pseudomonadota bacterium]
MLFSTVNAQFSRITIEASVRRIHWHGSVAFQITCRDITPRVRDAQRQAASAARLRSFARMGTDWFWEASPTLFITHVEGRFKAVTGLAESELVGHDWAELLSRFADRNSDWRKPLAELQTLRRRKDWRYGWVRPNGESRQLVSRVRALVDEQGTLLGFRGMERDVTELERARRSVSPSRAAVPARPRGAAAPSQPLLETVFEKMAEGMCMVAPDMRILALNSRLVELLELPTSVKPGAPFSDVLHIMAERGYYGEGTTDDLVAEREKFAVDFPNAHFVRRTPSGRMLDVRSSALAGGGFVRTFVDISEAHRLNHELSNREKFDELTGCLSRQHFEQTLTKLLQRRGSKERYALAFLDLDNFKVINETCGHASGDEYLRRVATELLQTPDLIVARLGGDEFGLLLTDTEPDQSLERLREIRQQIELLRFDCNGKTFTLGASLGLVLFEPHDADVSEVMRAADAACYTAKDLGGNQVYLYDPSHAEFQLRQSELGWVSQVTDALDTDAFALFVQSISPTRPSDASPRPSRFEVLLRMRNAFGDMVSPSEFLPAAERYNLASRVDEWVVRKLFAWGRSNLDAVGRIDSIALNLSGASIGNDAVKRAILDELDKDGFTAGQLCFEITETAAISHLSSAKAFIDTLRERGCEFALDDFGSGLSSFTYLRSLPFDILKIDGAFIEGIRRDSVNHVMVRSINDIGHALNKRTVAEFVQTETERELLGDLGVDYVQGFGIDRPQPIDNLL